MQIVIDIPEDYYKAIKEIPVEKSTGDMMIIHNGIPLKKLDRRMGKDVLDRIRAEIQKLRNCSCSNSDGIIDDVEDILDKYKAESEDKE